MLIKITPMPNPMISCSSPANFMIDNDDNIGVIPIFTNSLNAGFSLSISATCGENE